MNHLQQLLTFIFLLNILFISGVYPTVINYKINNGGRRKSPVNTKFRTAHIRYISTLINLVFFILYIWGEWIYCMTQYNHLFTICVVLFAYCLFKLVLIYPRAYFFYTKDGVEYHNGLWKRHIDNIENYEIWRFHSSWRHLFDSYWFIAAKTGKMRYIFINVLMFSNPKEIMYIIKDTQNKIKEKRK